MTFGRKMGNPAWPKIGKGLFDRLPVADIDMPEGEAGMILYLRQRGDRPCISQGIKNHHLMFAMLDQVSCKRRSDEARATRYQDALYGHEGAFRMSKRLLC